MWLPGKLSCSGIVLYTAHLKDAHLSACVTRALGAETVSHEAILFDVVVVVAGQGVFVRVFMLSWACGILLRVFVPMFLFADEMNGRDHRDFPIPDEFRVSRDASTGRWNYTQLAGVILKGILDYDNVLPQVQS